MAGYFYSGKLLLIDALLRALHQSEQIASLAVVVDAKDEAAEAFYWKYQFETLASQPRRLFLAMKTVATRLPG